MPYITQTIDIDLMKKILLASYDLKGKYFSFWFYHKIDTNILENVLKSLNPYFVTKKYLDPITEHKNSPPKSKTNVYILNKESIRELERLFPKLQKYMDSISVYNTFYDLLAYMIFHEDIAIIKDLSNVHEILKKHTIEFSDIAPKGW